MHHYSVQANLFSLEAHQSVVLSSENGLQLSWEDSKSNQDRARSVKATRGRADHRLNTLHWSSGEQRREDRVSKKKPQLTPAKKTSKSRALRSDDKPQHGWMNLSWWELWDRSRGLGETSCSQTVGGSSRHHVTNMI